MRKLYVINNFNGIYAVCEMEDKSKILIPIYKLPLGCKIGDFLMQNSIGMYLKDPLGKITKENQNSSTKDSCI